MIQAVPATNKTKKDTRKTCTVCKAKFQPSHRSAKTCSDDCKRARRNKSQNAVAKKVRKPKPFPISNGFVQTLLRHVRQAGTVQVLQYVTVDDLLELHGMYKLQNAGNAFMSQVYGEFQFCHVYPVRGQTHTGKFTPANLVIARAEPNRRHGCKHFAGGEFISPAHKSNRWDIQAWMEPIDIINLMIACIGRDVWAAFNKVAKLAPSCRQTHLDALAGLLDRANPAHAEWLKVFDDPRTTTPELKALLEAVTGGKAFTFGSRAFVSPMGVMVAETRRMCAHRPELEPVAVALEQIEQTSLYVDHRSFQLGEFEQYFFDVLHGIKIDLDELASVLNAALGQITDKVHSFDRKVPVRPIDLFTVEELAAYHEIANTSFVRAPVPSVDDGRWMDLIQPHQWM